MYITCPHCKTRLNVPDDKLPKDRDSSFSCPKCKGRVQVPAARPTAAKVPDPPVSPAQSPDAFAQSSESTFVSGQTAMVCMADGPVKSKVVDAVSKMGFTIETPRDIPQTLKKMEYHIYPLVLVDELFDHSQGFAGLSGHMDALDMSLRRRICLVLVSQSLRSKDNMAALHASVNCVLGPDGMDHVNQILSSAISDHNNLYIVYNDSMKAAGKA